MWVWDSENKRMVHREIKYVPGFFKIVDEILVNAADNKVSALHCPSGPVPSGGTLDPFARRERCRNYEPSRLGGLTTSLMSSRA